MTTENIFTRLTPALTALVECADPAQLNTFHQQLLEAALKGTHQQILGYSALFRALKTLCHLTDSHAETAATLHRAADEHDSMNCLFHNVRIFADEILYDEPPKMPVPSRWLTRHLERFHHFASRASLMDELSCMESRMMETGHP